MDGKGKERIRYDVTNVGGREERERWSDGKTTVSSSFNTIQYCS